ncbi:hypothetical protein BS47DRAFT_1369700 [Hydnum rufescens UP504]|uniref:Uncharacterized protein n=1 Tax=Hydnum rufescens UP504 TaxID=1448309 RepID=A0A9P6AC21_9AGAM|nr:hypothetical protein BS47DRAFT_1369700 [Hydnum rufescens UP504]
MQHNKEKHENTTKPDDDTTMTDNNRPRSGRTNRTRYSGCAQDLIYNMTKARETMRAQTTTHQMSPRNHTPAAAGVWSYVRSSPFTRANTNARTPVTPHIETQPAIHGECKVPHTRHHGCVVLQDLRLKSTRTPNPSPTEPNPPDKHPVNPNPANEDLASQTPRPQTH